jgi:Bacterial Ig domain
VDTAPACADTSASIVTGTTLTLAGDPCADADGDDYDIWTQQRTAHGSVDFPDNSDPVYTPDPGFVGVDTLGYFAQDELGVDSLDATLTITVTAAPAATPTPTPTPVIKDTTAPVAGLASAGNQKLKPVLAKGLRLTLTSNEAGKATVTVSVDAKTAGKLHIKREVGRATAIVRAGKLDVTVKLAAKARKALKKQRKVTLSVRAVVTDAAGNAGARSLTVRLKR